ncbi:hypothetical protein N7516_000334 [Penicillium verrucosum]|uniref:uncharacterized protein n=1 Tax=Penicillium verrucosum TaxID=60171 RepID=UPI002544E343|nr:uncharacterized protein N7516_000334 [Penicillium verrucosum]KAJ5940166.1 hypothetical protein N7516_000334 [Penicillium verrucosum]
MKDPTPFSGRPGESVKNYVKQCKYAWQGMAHMKEEEKREARAMTLLAGLRGSYTPQCFPRSTDV